MRSLALLSVAVSVASGQDPYATLPNNYKVELDNQFVKISRVRYRPGDKLPVHSHPSIPTVYVYLTDGGPIRFTHIEPKFTIERPAVKAGSIRFNRNAQVETHEVTYLGDQPTEYLRISLKTKPGPRHRDARLKTDSDFPWEDDQIRISRFPTMPGPSHAAVFVDVPDRKWFWVDAGKSLDPKLRWTLVIQLK